MSAVNRTNEPNGWERALIPLRRDAFREKVLSNVDRYLALSEQQSLTVGFYRRGEWYVFGNHAPDAALMYDIGSISKTVTAHLILRLVEEGRLELSRRVSDYLELTGDGYPTLYELLTHTAGYGHLTPATVTVPALFRHGYARKNIYDGCTAKTVLRCLSVNRGKRGAGYSYSDFPYAILAVVAERVTGIPFADLLEDFVQNDLNMKHTVITLPPEDRQPKAMQGRRVLRYWHWERSNPYIAGGGLVSNARDMLTYLTLQIESEAGYITAAHRLCQASLSEKRNLAMCIGWHTYKKSNQLWHVGGVGTFRSSIVLNKKRGIGVVVLGNSKGIASANVHYLAKMLYSEMKIKKIRFDRTEEFVDK